MFTEHVLCVEILGFALRRARDYSVRVLSSGLEGGWRIRGWGLRISIRKGWRSWDGGCAFVG